MTHDKEEGLLEYWQERARVRFEEVLLLRAQVERLTAELEEAQSAYRTVAEWLTECRAHYEALHSQQAAVPVGWLKQIQLARDVLVGCRDYPGIQMVSMHDAISELDAMLAAAPQPSQQAGEAVDCPYPCGWKGLFKIIVESGAHLARSLVEDEPINEHQRGEVMRMIGYAKDLCLFGMKLAPQPIQPSKEGCNHDCNQGRNCKCAKP